MRMTLRTLPLLVALAAVAGWVLAR